MKNISPYHLLSLLCGIIFSASVFAVKIIGAEISYEIIGKDFYRLQLSVYRECGGPLLCPNCPNSTSFKCPVQINIRGVEVPAEANIPPNPYAGQSFGSQNIHVIPFISGLEAIQLCNLVSSICTNCGQRAPGTFSPGIEIYKFEGTIDLRSLPDSCCLVNLCFDTCCRNNNIGTLTQSNPQNFYIQTTINRCLSYGNSSPIFTNAPVFLVCAGQDFSYNLGAIDPNGDSLSYALGAIRTGPSQGVTYKPPFSQTVPMPYLGYPAVFNESQKPLGFHLNPISGNIWFKPIDTFTSYLSIDVYEWRKISGIPTLTGISSREIQFYSKNCTSNTAPNILIYDKNGVPKTDNTFEICEGNEICFTFTAKDSTAAWDTTYLSFPSHRINPILPTLKKYYIDSLRQGQGPRHDSMQFCWTPPRTMASLLPHYFTISAKDNSCPFPLQSSKTVAIYVRDKPKAFINKTNRNYGKYSFSYIQTNLYPLDTNFTQYYIETAPKSNTYQFYRNSRVINHCFTQAGWHRIRLSLTAIHFDSNEACASEVWDSVFILPRVKINQLTKICQSNGVSIKVSSSGGTPLGNTYRYTFYTGKFGSNQVIRNFGPDSNFLLQSSHLQNSKDFYVVIQDLFGCKDSVAFEIDKDDVIKPDAMKIYDFCNSVIDSISINPIDTNIYIITWTYQNQVIDSAVSKIMPRGAGYYYINKTKQQSCWVTDTIKVMHSPPFTNTLDKIIKDSCEGNISLSSKTAWGWSHQWFIEFEPIASEKLAVFYPKHSGTYHVLTTDRGLCTRSSDTVTLTVYPKPKLMPILGSTYNLDTLKTFEYGVPNIPNLKYTWYLTNATALSRIDTNSILVRFNNTGSALLVAQYSNEYGCLNQTGLQLYIDEKTVGLNQVFKDSDILIYPNPATEAIYIDLKNHPSHEKYTIKVYTQLGQLVYQVSNHEKHHKISLAGWPKGKFYFVEIKRENQQLLHVEKVWVAE